MADSIAQAIPDISSLTTSEPAPPATAISSSEYHPSTLAIHADDTLRGVPDIAPPIHLSSTFHYSHNPDDLYTVADRKSRSDLPVEGHVYSRETTHNTARLETVLESLIGAPSVVYGSGLAALHALYVVLKPKRVAITGGYHGAHAVLSIQKRLTGLEVLPLDCDPSQLEAGDVWHVETPLNPTGEARNLEHYAKVANSRGAYVVVDATFGPPGLQDPFLHGADIVMHSGTKYFGGHSDLLCGVLSSKKPDWIKQLREDRTVLGSVMGGLEAWLVIRSLRTLSLRVEKASQNVAKLVDWLDAESKKSDTAVGKLVKAVTHASLQPEAKEEGSWLLKQMPNGWGPVFSFVMNDRDLAKRLPSQLKLFQHATSLGGVESLIEWRAMSDDTVDEGLIRVSVGVEDWDDLRRDLEQGFEKLASGTG